MMRSRAIWLGSLLGLIPATVSCAQLAGLTDDYHLGHAGTGANAGSGTGGSASTSTGGRGSSGGHADEADDAGAAGETSGEAGAGASAHGGQAATGGQGATGGRPSVIGSGGSNGTAGASNGGASGVGGSNNSAGSGGSAGSSALGPTRIGFSMFHDSAFGNDNASSHLADASFSKPPGTAAGDLILVFFGSDHSLSNLDGNTLMGLGWKLIDQHSDLGTDGQGTYLLYKIASANEPNPIVFKEINSPGSGNGVQGLLSVYRGVNVMEPVNDYDSKAVPTGADGANFVNDTPPITTTVPNCLLIAGLSPDTTVDRPVIDSWPDGFTENLVSVVNDKNPYPMGWANIYSAERHLPSAGTVPASSFGWHVTNTTEGGRYFGYLSFVLALAPAP